MSSKLEDYSVHISINPELVHCQNAVKEKLYDFNHARPSDEVTQRKILNELLGAVNHAVIVAPFYCDMGKNIHFKRGGFLNAGVKILDIAPVYFGEHVLIGPNVVISTTGHPIDMAELLPVASGNPITVGDCVWIGAGAIILDGVTIGDRSVIGAGSVVTKDIPADCIAVGNPCRVVKKIEHGEMPTEAELEELWRPVMEM
ncbi:sugar O-acetyltransferase [Photobacterium leiognathi subsp. mandapamensis]|uniref:sugar O-acetyltransferase n=1 Tax=Photobacterium leiognathi TaxID=553611 RepID=UPI003AF373F9